MYRNKIIYKYFISILLYILMPLSIVLCSCKKFVEVEAPPTDIFSTDVFSNDNNATSAVLSIYNRMIEGSRARFSSGNTSFSELAGLSADEFKNFSTDPIQGEFYSNNLEPQNYMVNYLWTELYRYIYDANTILENLNKSQGVSDPVKIQLAAEAKFIRGFCYFYLVNFFGDVPITVGTDYQQNSRVARNSQEEVYQNIIRDLEDAENALSPDYLDANNLATDERVRPNKSTAAALLSRVYLYHKDFQKAEQAATGLISDKGRYDTVSLADAFLKNSKEVIWSLQAVLPQWNAYDGYAFIITSTPNNVALTNDVLQQFEMGDLRRAIWIDSINVDGQVYFYPFKYKVRYLPTPTSSPTEYLVVFRLSEQYLIRAEARLVQGNIVGAQEDINIIRTKAGLPLQNFIDQPALQSSILHERQIELLTEWGHRWLDLKRTGNIDSVMSDNVVIKGSSWTHEKAIFPIPQTDIDRNPNLFQNPGY